jgi:hypothetical protein
MIGDTLLALESKMPVSETGAFGAVTARTFSDLFDSLSIADTGGMVKDSLLNSQQNFLNVPPYLVGVAVSASFRKEIIMEDDYNEEAEKILADALVHWLNEHDGDLACPIVDAIKRVAIEDAIILGVDDGLWIAAEAWRFINRKYQHSDEWFYAVIAALEAFKAQFVLAGVQS